MTRIAFRPGALALGLLTALACSLAATGSAHAEAGALDPSFGQGGLVTTSFGSTNDQTQAVAIQPDGKSVHVGCSAPTTACGSGSAPTGAKLALTRYNPDGSLDGTFGVGGKVQTDLNATYASLKAVAIQRDGKIVVTGGVNLVATTQGSDFVIARYTSAGKLDPTFGGGTGYTVTTVGPDYDQANGLALLPDGKVVVAGTSERRASSSDPGNDDFALARYNADGTLDTSFTGDGIVLTAFTPQNDGAGDVLFDRNGRYVAVGETKTPEGINFAVARYSASGRLDPTFSGDGKQTTDFGGGGNDYAGSVSEQRDGKLVVAGEANTNGPTGDDYGLVRYLPGGNPDPSFGTGGKVTTSFGNGKTLDAANTVRLQRDGKIVAGGDSILPTGLAFSVARYNPNGSLDPTFSGDGRATAGSTGRAFFGFGLALRGNGRILMTGYASASTGFDFAAAQFQGDEADLKVGLTDRPDPADRGTSVTYSSAVRNLGPEAARDARFQMALPSRARLVAVRTSSGRCFRLNAKTLRCVFGTVASRAAARVTVWVRAVRRGTLRSRVAVANDTFDPNVRNNRARTSTHVRTPR